MYRIKSTVEQDDLDGPLYWNNRDGWVDRASATVFTEPWPYLPLHSEIEEVAHG